MAVGVNTNGKHYKWEVVLLLWVAFFLNQADRQAFNVVLPQIQEHLGASDSTMGLLAMLFNVLFAVTIPFAGYYADRMSRSRQAWVSTLFFSVATLFTGLFGGLFWMIVCRCFGTGIGQGLFAPTYTGIIAQYHDSSTRAMAISVHQTSSYVGIIVCGFFAGKIAETLGWQYVFFILGGIGLVFTPIMMLRLRDKPKEEEKGDKSAPEAVSFPAAIATIFKVPTAVCILIAYCALIFGLNGYLTWMPKCLKDTFSLSLSSAGFHSMFWPNAAAFAGIMIAGSVSDRIAACAGGGGNRLLLQAGGLLLASPCIVLMGLSDSLVTVCAALAGFGFFRGFYDSSLFAVFYDVIPPKFYSISAAILFLFGYGIGALAPWILGIISDHIGLSAGIASMAAIWAAGSLVLIFARIFFFDKDVAKMSN